MHKDNDLLLASPRPFSVTIYLHDELDRSTTAVYDKGYIYEWSVTSLDFFAGKEATQKKKTTWQNDRKMKQIITMIWIDPLLD